jgi:hypothetical protein
MNASPGGDRFRIPSLTSCREKEAIPSPHSWQETERIEMATTKLLKLYRATEMDNIRPVVIVGYATSDVDMEIVIEESGHGFLASDFTIEEVPFERGRVS